MNILFSIPPVDGWIRAASYLGHNGFELNEHIFDSFNKAKPDLLIAFGNESKELHKCLNKFKTPTILIDSYLPAADCPPNFESGLIKNDYKCDAVIVGQFNKTYLEYLYELSNSNIDFRIFGSGNWAVPQYLGWIHPTEIANTYASAKWSLDLEGEFNRVLAINSAGGNALSAGKWNVGVEQLDKCIGFESPLDLIEKIKIEPIKFNSKTPTLSDRLQEILETYNVNMGSN